MTLSFVDTSFNWIASYNWKEITHLRVLKENILFYMNDNKQVIRSEC